MLTVAFIVPHAEEEEEEEEGEGLFYWQLLNIKERLNRIKNNFFMILLV